MGSGVNRFIELLITPLFLEPHQKNQPRTLTLQICKVLAIIESHHNPSQNTPQSIVSRKTKFL